MFISVDLPAPFSPSSACTSPFAQVEADVVVGHDAREPASSHGASRGRSARSAIGARYYGLQRMRGEGARPWRRGGRAAARPSLDPVDSTLLLSGALILPAAMQLRDCGQLGMISVTGALMLIRPKPTPPFLTVKSASLPPANLPSFLVLRPRKTRQVDLLRRAREDERAEERLVVVDADAPLALLLCPLEGAEAAAACCREDDIRAGLAIWFSASSLHFAWSTKSSE